MACGQTKGTFAIEGFGEEHEEHVCSVEAHPDGADPAEELHVCDCGGRWPLEDD